MAEAVLVVEDEPDLAALMADYLADAGFRVVTLADGGEALARIRVEPPRLLVLDLMLPGMDGLALCRAVRGFSTLPVIMVTARVREVDRLLGLETGADDYLCKPFSPRELVARVRAVLRRTGGGDGVASPVTIDEAARRVSVHRQPLDLTVTEYNLLAAMARRPGTIYSRAQLLDIAGRDSLDVTDRAVDSHIKNLRRKLAAALPGVEVIHSVYGLGYRVEF